MFGHSVAILCMYPLHDHFEIRSTLLRVEFPDPKIFLRPVVATSCSFVNPTSSVSQSLRFCQISFAAPQSVFGTLTFGNVNHNSAQPCRSPILNDHGNEIANPHNRSIGGNHAVLKIVAAFLARRPHAELHRPVAIFGVKVVLPELRFAQPMFRWVSQDAFRLRADE